jgi:hypothetical protein
MRRNGEQGTAILITMLLTVSLLAGGAVLLGMQLSSTKSVDVQKTRTLALHCAEAGIAAARREVAAGYPQWTTTNICNQPAPLGTGTCVVGAAGNEPTFLSAIVRDLDVPADGNPDFRIHIVDDDDGDGDMSKDNNLQVFVVSTCIKYGDIKQQVRELIKVNPGNPGKEEQKNGSIGIGQ